MPRVLLIVSFFLLGCIQSDVSGGSGPTIPDDTTSGGGGGIQRQSVTIRARFDAADQAVAQTAGLTVSGLTVRLARLRSATPAMVATTDATGAASFSGLLAGPYEVSIERALTAQEIARLDPTDREVALFAAGASVTVASGPVELPVDLVASRRGSLTISEFFIYSASTGGSPNNNGHYIEVYNNADTTIYLDGIVMFRTGNRHHAGFTDELPCSVNEAIRMDATAVWAITLHRFPGTGREYPLSPGRAALVAIDATNQTSIGPGLQDLRHARFEFIGDDADPNNPLAQDMVRMTRYYGANRGEVFTSTIVVGLALPLATDTTQLERRLGSAEGGATFAVFRVPSEFVLDAVGLRPPQAVEESTGAYRSGYRVCAPFTNARFDRAEARLVDLSTPLAISRKSLGRTADGREILQRTVTSSRDFELVPPLRRSPAQ